MAVLPTAAGRPSRAVDPAGRVAVLQVGALTSISKPRQERAWFARCNSLSSGPPE